MVCSAIVTVISNSALDFRLFIISQVDAIARAININCPVIYVSEFLLKINREKRLNYFFFIFNFLCKKKQKQQQKEILLLFFKKKSERRTEYSKERIVIFIHCHSMEWWSLLLSSWYLRMMILFISVNLLFHFFVSVFCCFVHIVRQANQSQPLICLDGFNCGENFFFSFFANKSTESKGTQRNAIINSK